MTVTIDLDGTKPWIAAYWRHYRACRKIGLPKSTSRRVSGKNASIWWQYMVKNKED